MVNTTRGAATERAAGGVVWRWAEDDGVEIAVVHRPHYDDWSLPKGKIDKGETWLGAAVREVREETGLAVEVGRLLGDEAYVVRRGGRPVRKVVRYWAMRAVGGEFTPNDEVDELRWLAPEKAEELLSHEGSREIVHRFRLL
ncbi:MAG: NUDIX hydrolase [Frankia sp.]|nr:NUDIX hydrolase [Frankia sp.]